MSLDLPHALASVNAAENVVFWSFWGLLALLLFSARATVVLSHAYRRLARKYLDLAARISTESAGPIASGDSGPHAPESRIDGGAE
mgnify:CR=1 FL=1